MSTLQHSASNNWHEPAPGNVTLPLVAYLQKVSAGIFTPATSGENDAAQIDVDNNGVYKPLDLNDRLYYIDVAGVPTLSTTGTEAYILVEVDGVLQLTDDLTAQPTAEMYADGDGRYITTGSNGGDGLQLIAAGSNITPFI